MIQSRKVLSFFLLSLWVFAQTDTRDFDRELDYQSRAVKDLKLEIESTKQRIQGESQREASAARRISNLEEEISLAAGRLQGQVPEDHFRY